MSGKLRTAFALLATAAMVAACSSSGATAAPSGSSLKIGVVTDVGTVTDHTFNQYTWEGAKQAAADLGATANYAVPKDASDYAKDIQGFVDQKYNIIVAVGFNLGTATITAAKANPDIWFIAIDVAPCVDKTGAFDSTFACEGDASKLLPKLIGVQFQEDQVGYIAGIVAAAMSKTGVIGTIGGVNTNPAVVKYMQGFQLGAASYKSSVQVKTAFYSTGDLTKAYGDPAWGKTFGAQFISQQGVDVVFPVAGGTGNATLDAACDANIYAIGVDVDEYLFYTSADKCIVTSAEKHVSSATSQLIKAIAAGTAKGGVSLFNAANDGVGYSPFHNASITLPSDVQGKLDAAFAEMKAGTLKTCPDKCGTWPTS